MTSTVHAEATLTWCGACDAPPMYDAESCPACGAALHGGAADRLRLVATERRQLRAYVADATGRLQALDAEAGRLAALLRLPLPTSVPAAAGAPTAAAPVAGGPAAVAPTAAAPLAPAAPRPPRPKPSPRAVLTWTGGILLALAGIAFAVWAWTVFGPLGRFGILVAVTVLAAVVAHLVRRHTPVTAESLDLVAVVLLLVDWVVARAMVPAAVTAVGGDVGWAAVGAVVVGVVALLLARVEGSRVLPHLGVVLASAGLVVLAADRLSTVELPSAWWLVATAAVGWLPLLPLLVGWLPARRWPTVAVTVAATVAVVWLGTLGALLPVVDHVAAGQVDGMATAAALLGLPIVPLLAHRALPARWRSRRWTGAYGVAAALGGLVASASVLAAAWHVADGWFPGASSDLHAAAGAAAWALVAVAAAWLVARFAPPAPLRTGAAATLATVAALLWAFGQFGLAILLDADGSAAHLLRSAGVAALLALPAVVAAIGVPRLPGPASRRRAGLAAVLPYVAAASCWYAALIGVAAVAVAVEPVLPASLVCGLAAVVAAAVAALLARRARTVALGAVPGVAVVLLVCASLALVPGSVTAPQLAALLACLGAVLLLWRAAAGTYLLARPVAFLPVVAATAALLCAGGLLLQPMAGTALAALAVGAAGTVVWLLAARWARLAPTGAVGGAAATAVVVTALLRLLSLPYLVPGLGLSLPSADVLAALVAAWLLAAAVAALLRGGWLPLPAGVWPGVSVAYGPILAVTPAVAVLLLAAALPAPAWVPATAFVVAAAAGWTLFALPYRRTAHTVVALTAAGVVTALAAGWVLPLTWGPTVLAAVVAAAAAVAAVRARVAWVEVVAATVAAASGAAVVPLGVVAAGYATAGPAWPALTAAMGGAVLLAAAPSLPGRDAVRLAVTAVGATTLVAAALMPSGALVLGTVLALAAAALLLASRWSPLRPLRYAGLLTAVGAAWAYLAAGSVSVLEAWTVPAAAGLLAAGLVAARDPHRPALRHPSWLTVGPALTVLVVPSAVLLLAGEAPLWRLAGLGVLGAAALAWGLGRHEQAPAALGLVAVAAVAVQVLTPVVAATPLWVVLTILGVALTWTGFTWERRRTQARHAVEHWAHFV